MLVRRLAQCLYCLFVYANYIPELLTVFAKLKIPVHLVAQMEFKCSKIIVRALSLLHHENGQLVV